MTLIFLILEIIRYGCELILAQLLITCNSDVSYNEGSLQEVRTVTMTMMDVECLRLI